MSGTSMRGYVVDNCQPGCMPDRAEPSHVYRDEAAALSAWREAARDAAAQAWTENRISDLAYDEILDAIAATTVKDLANLYVTEEVNVLIGGRLYYCMATLEIPEEVKSNEGA